MEMTVTITCCFTTLCIVGRDSGPTDFIIGYSEILNEWRSKFKCPIYLLQHFFSV